MPKVTQQKLADLESEYRVTVSAVGSFDYATMLSGRNQSTQTRRAGIVWPENCQGPTYMGDGVMEWKYSEVTLSVRRLRALDTSNLLLDLIK